MKRIALTQGKEAIVDDEDYEYLMQWKWYAVRNRKSFYAARTVRSNGKRKIVFIHQELTARRGWFDCQVDHRDRDGLNNQRANLRPATVAQNTSNQGPYRNNTSGAKGVSWHAHTCKWHADVFRMGLRASRYFDDFNEAVAWRDAKAKEFHGEFAYLNGVA